MINFYAYCLNLDSVALILDADQLRDIDIIFHNKKVCMVCFHIRQEEFKFTILNKYLVNIKINFFMRDFS